MVFKKCGAEAFCKSGFMKEKQMYKCKACGMNQTEGDLWEKYPESVKNAALAIYLEGNGFRRTAKAFRQILQSL